MKNILLVGCGERFGLELTQQYLQNGWTVFSLGQVIPEGCQGRKIDWQKVTPHDVKKFANELPPLDAIFFNQNCGSPPNIQSFREGITDFELDFWMKSVWVNNQLPVYLISCLGDKLSEDSVCGWLLGWGSVNSPVSAGHWEYIGYGIQKTTNFMLMRCMSKAHKSLHYALDPGGIPEDQRKVLAEKVFTFQQNLTKDMSGRAMQIHDGSDVYVS